MCVCVHVCVYVFNEFKPYIDLFKRIFHTDLFFFKWKIFVVSLPFSKHKQVISTRASMVFLFLRYATRCFVISTGDH